MRMKSGFDDICYGEYEDACGGKCVGCPYNGHNGTICCKTGEWCYISKKSCDKAKFGPPKPTKVQTEKQAHHQYTVTEKCLGRKNKNASREVICPATGERWKSVSAAATALDVDQSTLSRHLQGKAKTCTKRVFEYVGCKRKYDNKEVRLNAG